MSVIKPSNEAPYVTIGGLSSRVRSFIVAAIPYKLRGRRYQMSAPGWPEAFVRVLTKEEILRPSYLFSVFNDGTVYCKACGAPITEPRDEHIALHEQELDILYRERQEAAQKARSEALRASVAARKAEKAESTVSDTPGFYKAPCSVCGNKIPRSGKPGRPPAKCEECTEAF